MSRAALAVVVSFFLELYKGRGGNSLNFRNNMIRFLEFNNLTELLSVEHRECMRPVSYLHSRRIFISVECDNLHSIALQFDCKLFAELT